MNSAIQLAKNLFKLGLVALQYVIVYLNLDTRSSVLRDFVKSEAPEVEVKSHTSMSIAPDINISIFILILSPKLAVILLAISTAS